uniref:Fucosyltransferase N-terminal domain-containing protein n=1 Tax=Parascaris univalens TaxID=6257 RepID=A0A914ZX01_PARUN
VISSFSDKERKSPTNRSVVILTWTSFFGSDLAVQFYMNGLAKCKYVCTATSNRRLFYFGICFCSSFFPSVVKKCEIFNLLTISEYKCSVAKK